MSHAEYPLEVGIVEVCAGGVAGLVLGLVAFPIIALMSPLCLWTGSAGACGVLSRGIFLLLDAVEIPLTVGFYGVVVIGVGAIVVSTFECRL